MKNFYGCPGLFVSVLLSAQAFSQDTVFTNEGYKFAVIEDGFETAPALYVGPDIFALNVGTSFCFGAGLDVNYFINRKWGIKANYYFPYFDSEYSEFSDLAISNGVYARRGVQMDLGGTYYFGINIKDDPDASVYVGNEGETSVRLKVPVPTEYKSGVRLHYFFFQQAYSSDRITGDTTSTGEEISIAGFESHMLCLGFSRTNSWNYVLNSTRFGTSTRQGYKTRYIDFMLNMSGTVNYDLPSQEPYEFDDSHIGWRNIGFRIGMDRSLRVKDRYYLRIAAEYSYRAIPKYFYYSSLYGGYFNLKFGVHFVR